MRHIFIVKKSRFGRKGGFRFDTINMRWSIEYYEGSQVKFCKDIILLSLKIIFVLANSEYPDEMPHYGAFYLFVRVRI